MIIRVALIASLVSLLALVLYIPSATPPERFFELVRAEHATNQRVWGEDAAAKMMQTMLDLTSESKKVSDAPSLPSGSGPTGQDAINSAMADELGQMNARLFNNPYFRSIDALFMLAAYRIAALMQIVPLVLVFAAASIVDGFVVRTVRSKEFIQHNPELYVASASLSIVLLCAVALATFAPVRIAPHVVAGALLLASFVGSRAVANFHRRG